MAKSSRINLRTSPAQEEVIKKAAEITHSTMSEFVLSRATLEAEKILADQRWFTLNDSQFESFSKMLDSPFDHSRVRALLERETSFGQEFTL